MQTKLLRLCAGAACAVSAVCAQEAAFYRILSPAGSGITAFSAGSGVIAWTNAATAGVTCTVQRASSLAPADWRDVVRHEATNTAVRLRLDDPAAPEGMAYIPAGSFEMGIDDESDYNPAEVPVHWVYVSAFYMAKTEVTWSQWSAVRTWAVANGYAFDNAVGGKAAAHPVHTVNWFDAVKWCNARSEMEGLPVCYFTDAAKTLVYRTGQVAPTVAWSAGGYRLPTEAEWEKAARGGPADLRFPHGDTITHADANFYSDAKYANYDFSDPRGYHPDYDEGAYPYTSPVGSFAPNGYGLYDMVGNILEWCWDWWSGDYYSTSPYLDPRGPETASSRALRGGRGGWMRDTSGWWTATTTARPPITAAPAITTSVSAWRAARGRRRINESAGET